MNFFVIGLPRSRTAWMANFLTQGQHCFHEGLDGCISINEYKEKLGNDNGDASTGLMLFDMNSEFPDAPKLIIESDAEKAIEYGYKTYGIYDPQYIYSLQERMDLIDGLRIPFDDIDDRLEEIWGHLIGTPFDKQRADLLKKLKIEVKDPFGFDLGAMEKLCSTINLT